MSRVGWTAAIIAIGAFGAAAGLLYIREPEAGRDRVAEAATALGLDARNP